jgi:DNA-binding response OmpR family regulator
MRKPPLSASVSVNSAHQYPSRADISQTALLVSPLEEDHTSLSQTFGTHGWRLHAVSNLEDGVRFLERNRIPVVIAERDLRPGSWKDLQAELPRSVELPLLIVTSRFADDRLWAEVLNMGGYDVLIKPFDQMELYRVLSLAWHNWDNTAARNRSTALRDEQRSRAKLSKAIA